MVAGRGGRRKGGTSNHRAQEQDSSSHQGRQRASLLDGSISGESWTTENAARYAPTPATLEKYSDEQHGGLGRRCTGDGRACSNISDI